MPFISAAFEARRLLQATTRVRSVRGEHFRHVSMTTDDAWKWKEKLVAGDFLGRQEFICLTLINSRRWMLWCIGVDHVRRATDRSLVRMLFNRPKTFYVYNNNSNNNNNNNIHNNIHNNNSSNIHNNNSSNIHNNNSNNIHNNNSISNNHNNNSNIHNNNNNKHPQQQQHMEMRWIRMPSSFPSSFTLICSEDAKQRLCVRAWVCACMCLCLYVCACVCLYVFFYVYARVNLYVFVYMCVCEFVCGYNLP